MTLIYPERGDDSSDNMLSEAQEIFQRTTSALNVLVRELEANNTDNAGEAARLVKELKAALYPAMAERERLEEKRKKSAGIVHDFAIDFDAARHEIGRRLACLRAAGGQGRVPE